jgi:hypothetical protein
MQYHAFLASEEDECSASLPGRITLWERALGNHCMEIWVVTVACLSALKHRRDLLRLQGVYVV